MTERDDTQSPPPPSDRERRVFETGTTEATPTLRLVRAGAVTAAIDAGALRRIAHGEVELVRQIDFPVRDRNWATLPPQVTHEALEEGAAGLRYERRFEVDDGALVCRVVYEIDPKGIVTATGEATATRDFVTNRTGFTVLHPIAGVAGRPVVVTSPTGETGDAVMPGPISPVQPIKAIAGLAFTIEGVPIDLAFSGEVFEMEDQRNWSDASFKTYCRPLVEPFAHVISTGATVRQQIRLTIGDADVSTADADRGPVSIGAPTDEILPELLLAGEAGWLPDAVEAERLARSGLGALLLRVTPEDADARLSEARALLATAGASLDLEIVIADDEAAAPQLARVAEACRRAGAAPRHVVALPAAYLASYQPTGQWPTGLDPRAAFEAARAAFAGARIGGGVLTNFTEFNRCRPDGFDCDYVSHGTSATVHAADDASVAQTLEALPDIFRSARAIGGARPYRLGLVAIGMRTNPYGDAVSANPEQRRLTMATWDPRARALFGAAWAIGALAATAGCGVEAIALAAPIGPFGLLATAGGVARPWFDDHPEAVVHPIFHALRSLAGGGRRCEVRGLADGLAGVAVVRGDRVRLVVANLAGAPRRLPLDRPGSVAILDAAHFAAAAADPDWLDHASAPSPALSFGLAPASLIFVDREL